MNFDNIKIIINANCNMHYCGFYVYGLQQVFAKKNIEFSFKEFENIVHANQCLLLKISNNTKIYNVAIDFHDSTNIDENVLIWSEIYAKINLNQSLSTQSLGQLNDFNFNQNWNKIISIPPSFGIRVFSLWQTIKHILLLLINIKWNSVSVVKNVILDNIRMYVKRLPISNYFHKNYTQNYVFMIASIWHKTTSYVNLSRANFIRACKQNNTINFNGGLVDIGYDCDYIPDLNDLKVGNTKISLSEYIIKTQQSNFVFNCPSVAYCHGWKLSEYLCLGKAIISTELSNDLPEPLIHGVNIHFVKDDLESIIEAVNYLLENPEYVKKLENGAQEYWKKYCTPTKIIESIVAKTLPFYGAS